MDYIEREASLDEEDDELADEEYDDETGEVRSKKPTQKKKKQANDFEDSSEEEDDDDDEEAARVSFPEQAKVVRLLMGNARFVKASSSTTKRRKTRNWRTVLW